MKILANDGISEIGIQKLQSAGFEVVTTKVAQEQLANYINEHKLQVLLVRSATYADKSLIEACPTLKVIGRGGVGMDNIDVEYAKSKGIQVINTPASSSASVAELVFAHLFSGVRFLQDSNRQMPLVGESKFADLKKNYGAGTELRGKTLGIIGLGRIGAAAAKIAIGLGMKVIGHDPLIEKTTVSLDFFDGRALSFEIKSDTFEDVLKSADFISLHVPAQDKPLIGEKEFSLMKKGSAIVNAARGGALDEAALLKALDSGHLSFAGLDVFESEPTPSVKVLMHPKISLTPHIGAATKEAQDRIGAELADQLISLFKKA